MEGSSSRIPWLSKRDRVLSFAGLAIGILYLIAQFTGVRWLSMICKPIPVLLMAYWVSTLPGKGRYQLAVAVGLLFSAAGDILLNLPPEFFVLGLAAFLLAHVAYTVAFSGDSRQIFPARALGAYLFGATMFALLYFAGDLGEMTIPVLAYVFVISTMLWRAACRVGAPGVSEFSAKAGMIGALLFTLSDAVLALNMFLTPIPLATLIIMSMYWSGQLGITLSARR
ncbi:MAG: lysoplasmalogenase [Chloroflexota bacterium]|nr:lysoplasmalogenase [Chloroflexota bacterium]